MRRLYVASFAFKENKEEKHVKRYLYSI